MKRPALLLLALAALLSASCEATNNVVPIPPPPVAQSPMGALFLLEWSWDNREYAQLPGLFPEDYRFISSSTDSAGNPFVNAPWTREDELISSANCFGAARGLTFTLDPNLVVLDDDRPGKDPRWHKTIRTQATLQGNLAIHFDVQGHEKFYFVRGDSAVIPPELIAQGYAPDSTLWWIDRWEDETAPDSVTSAHPTRQLSWGAFKQLFR